MLKTRPQITIVTTFTNTPTIVPPSSFMNYYILNPLFKYDNTNLMFQIIWLIIDNLI